MPYHPVISVSKVSFDHLKPYEKRRKKRKKKHLSKVKCFGFFILIFLKEGAATP